jgi:hypothetical protein
MMGEMCEMCEERTRSRVEANSKLIPRLRRGSGRRGIARSTGQMPRRSADKGPHVRDGQIGLQFEVQSIRSASGASGCFAFPSTR